MRGTNIADKRFLSLSNVQSNHLICRVVSDTGKKYCNSNSNTWWKKYCNTDCNTFFSKSVLQYFCNTTLSALQNKF